jgi:hypothetical protein
LPPANAVFTVPETLKVRALNVVMIGSHFIVIQRRMEQFSFIVLVSHQCFSYVTDKGPVKLILVSILLVLNLYDSSSFSYQAHLEANPAWGLTAQVKDTKSQICVVKSCLRKLLTSRRNTIKTLVS